MMNFTTEQLSQLQAEFATINTVNPERLEEFHAMFAKCTDDMLKQLIAAKIKFVSRLAINACRRRGVAL